MKKLTLVALIAAGALAVPGSAGAKSSVTCQITPNGTVFSSPGEMFRDARKSFGFTPPELAATFGYSSPGDMIKHVCTSGRDS